MTKTSLARKWLNKAITIKELIATGWKPKQIAKEIKVSLPLVYKWKNKEIPKINASMIFSIFSNFECEELERPYFLNPNMVVARPFKRQQLNCCTSRKVLVYNGQVRSNAY